METLRKGGFGGVKMFTKEDLKDLSADELVQTVSIKTEAVKLKSQNIWNWNLVNKLLFFLIIN